MPKLTFYTEEHEYRVDDIKIPGFSQIAKDFGLVDFSKAKPADLEYRRALGTNTHKAIFLDNTNDLNVSSCDIPTISLLNSWKMFCELTKPAILTQYSEVPICSFRYRYGVTPDMIADVNGKLTIIEIKTGSVNEGVVALQTMAQQIAIEETYNIKIKQRWGLQLIEGAMPRLIPCENAGDLSAWISCVNVWHLRERFGLWKR